MLLISPLVMEFINRNVIIINIPHRLNLNYLNRLNNWEKSTMEQQWNSINNEKDIEYVSTLFGYFYDACIKEVKYISGSYVGDDSRMKTTDDLRQVYMIIQKQNKEHSVIEFLFDGVERFNLVPANEEYDSIISGLLLKIIGKQIYFANSPDIKIDELDKNSNWITWIKAKSLKWREINKYIGDSLVYVYRD